MVALADLYGAMRTQLVRSVVRTCPRWLADQAEDIVQTAIAQVVDFQARTGETEAVTPSYLLRAAQNAAIDEIRRRFRRPETVAEHDLDMTPEPVRAERHGRGPDPFDLHAALRACLAGLVASRRRAVTLHLLGYSLVETAATLGSSRKQADHLTYRGLADLRRCLESKGVGP